jgi:hypothetical protein
MFLGKRRLRGRGGSLGLSSLVAGTLVHSSAFGPALGIVGSSARAYKFLSKQHPQGWNHQTCSEEWLMKPHPKIPPLKGGD